MGSGSMYRPPHSLRKRDLYGVQSRDWLGVLIPAAAVVGTIAVFAFVARSIQAGINDNAERSKATWEGATIVRICFDGTRIYRMRDGSYRTSWNDLKIESPEVCGTGAKP